MSSQTQTATIHMEGQWQIGDVRITKFVEEEFAGSVHRFLLLDATPEACKEIDCLKPYFMTENGELRL